MDFSRLTDGLTRRVEGALGDVGGALFEPVVRLGVTGLSRAGKTVFITSLVANLIDRGRMPQLRAEAEGRILAAYLQPQPDHTIPRFAYEDHLAALTGARAALAREHPLDLDAAPVAQGRADRPDRRADRPARRASRHRRLPGRVAARPAADEPELRGLVDRRHRDRARRRRGPRWPRDWLAELEARDPAAPLEEGTARSLAAGFTAYLAAARAAGLSSVAPGRFLMPGDLEGSPALTFSPLPKPARRPSASLWRAFEQRFEAYKRVVVGPFFRNHFARLDRQVVLIDALGAIHDGPRAVEDLRAAMAEILACFRPGPRSWLAPILGRRIDRILFAATKADHLHHSQHARLAAIAEALVRDARARAQFSGAETRALSIASLRATVEQTVVRDGREVDVVRGRLVDTGAEAALFPGDLPDDPAAILAPARQGARRLERRRLPRHPLRAAAAPAAAARACRTSASTAPPSS